jgi:aminodeoxyfutalosine deaminase
MILSARWLLPIANPPVRDGWIEIDGGSIRRLGQGQAPPGVTHLGDVAVLPGLVNAHTHLELSWMAGLIPPAASMSEWITTMMRTRRGGAPGGDEAARQAAHDAAALASATGTVLVGDVSNTLMTPPVLQHARLGGVVFHEMLGFSAPDPAGAVTHARARATEAERSTDHALLPIAVTVTAHAPYSVSPALFREIVSRRDTGPLSVHLGESPEEIEFLRTGRGPIRESLEALGVWTDSWPVPECDPVEYMHRMGYLQPGMLAVHGVHLDDDALARLASADAIVVTCPRSNLWVGAGMPRIAHFYAAAVPVAIGTDSLASVASLNMFDEMAELRRIAPDVTAASFLESATRVGAEALGLGRSFGTLEPGKRAELVVVDIPSGVTDVEEYLVSGVPASAVRRIF